MPFPRRIQEESIGSTWVHSGKRCRSSKIKPWLRLPSRWSLTFAPSSFRVTSSLWKPLLFGSNSPSSSESRPASDCIASIVKPETAVSWHRAGFRLFWRWRFRQRRPGRPKASGEIRQLIRAIGSGLGQQKSVLRVFQCARVRYILHHVVTCIG